MAVLLTGIPSGVVPGFQNNTGSTLADQLRLNMAIPLAVTTASGRLGRVARDAAILITPEERRPPQILARANAHIAGWPPS